MLCHVTTCKLTSSFHSCIEQEPASTVHSCCWRPCRRWPERMRWREACGPPEPVPIAQPEVTSAAWGASPCPWRDTSSVPTAPTSTTVTARAHFRWPTPPTTLSCSTPTLRGRGLWARVWRSGTPAACPWPTKTWPWCSWMHTGRGLSSKLWKMWWRRNADAVKAAGKVQSLNVWRADVTLLSPNEIMYSSH